MAEALKFRKKPVVVEAVRVADAMVAAAASWSDLPQWLRNAYETGNIVFGSDGIYVQTLEGNMFAPRPDWLILGIAEEIYPCRADIFAATYEPVVSE